MIYVFTTLVMLVVGCEGIKHQQKVDRELEDIGVSAAQEAVKSLDEDNADREAARAIKK